MTRLEEELERLAKANERERLGTRARFAAERTGLDLTERVLRGLALRDLAIEEVVPASGDRVRLWLRSRSGLSLRDLRVGEGDPVVLWWDDPDEPDRTRAIASRRDGELLSVVLEGEVPDRLWEEGFRLDREAPEVTFDRAAKAIARAQKAAPGTPIHALLAAITGEAAIDPPRSTDFAPLDRDLTPDQHTAVARALGATRCALVLGPPGTGKTRTLSELVRQSIARGERVLVTAASHTAVDNLGERLVAAGVPLVRLGHPARVAASLEARTLDALVEATEAYKTARGWSRQAEAARRTIIKRVARGALRGHEKREAFAEVRSLMRDSRAYLRDAQRGIVASAPCIAATASGADSRDLDDERFDLVVLDEATQVPDTVALSAILRAPRLVMAGDPHQLPPTVIDEGAIALGLGSTFFERAASRAPEGVVTTLRVQHRMHEALMAFPNAQTYGGVLIAAPAVAHARIEDLPGIAGDVERAGPFVLIDTAGCGFDETGSADDPSTVNPAQADRTAAEVRRILARGVAAIDVGVITPYFAQVRALRDRLAPELAHGLEVSTVDGFQGREKLAIVVDLVRSNPDGAIGFLGDRRRTNVAITRAKRLLVVVGDGATLGAHPYYAALFAHAEATGAWRSAFDS